MIRRSKTPASIALITALACGGCQNADYVTHLPKPPMIRLAATSDWLSHDDTAFILGPSGIPQPSDSYLQTVYRDYLVPNGFDGPDTFTTVSEGQSIHLPLTGLVSIYTPEAETGTSSGMAQDEALILNAIAAQAPTDDHPLTLFGYSQSAAAISAVVQQLEAHDGILGAPDGTVITVDANAIHVVLIGNSASPDGLLANGYNSLPAWAQQILLANEKAWGIDGIITDPTHAGVVTPDDYFQTVAYSLPTDGYANWSTNLWEDLFTQLFGLFSTHLEYLGMNPVDGVDASIFTSRDELDLVSLIPPDDPLQAMVAAAANVGWMSSCLADELEGWL